MDAALLLHLHKHLDCIGNHGYPQNRQDKVDDPQQECAGWKWPQLSLHITGLSKLIQQQSNLDMTFGLVQKWPQT